MANKLVKRRYNNLLTARNNYFGNGGFELPPVDTSKMLVGNSIDTALASLSKAQPIAIPNPDPYKNAKVNKGMSKGMSGALSALGPIVGQVGGNAISGGLQSGAGNLISGLSGIASAIPGPWGAVASTGLGLIGGLANRMFGSKMNTENIAKVEANINELNNFTSNASDFDTLSNNWANAATGMTFDNDFIGKDGWFSHKARDKANSLRDQIETGEAWVQNVLDNNANNISETQMQNLLANYAAYGGPLFAEGGRIHIKPENRGKFTETKRRTGKTTEELTHSKNPLTRKRAIFAQNAKKWHHAFGGDLMTHGANFDTDDSLSNSNYKEGEIYDVTEEEVKILKRLGYGFEYV